jgi:hypothetical protein
MSNKALSPGHRICKGPAMPPHTTAASEDVRPTERDVLTEVARHPQGIDALTLVSSLEAKGYDPYSIQRVIRRALDKGSLELGSKLRLRVSEEAA